MELVSLIILSGVIVWLSIDKYNNQKTLLNLTKEVDKLKKEKYSLTLANNELSHDKIKLDGILKKVVLENNFFKDQLTKISKLMIGFTSPLKNGKMVDPLLGFDPSTFFNGDERYTKTQNIKKETTYNVDDILIEIGEVGIKNVSKDKLDFLKNYKQ